MLGSLASGRSHVYGFLEGEDCLATMKAFTAMGVSIKRDGQTLIVDGVGLNGLCAPKDELNLGNSGTSMRLMSGLMAAQSFDSVLTGDASLQSRPMRRVTGPLSQMGASIITESDGTAPLHFKGGQKLTGIHYDMPVASAQVKSALLLAGLYAEGETIVVEPAASRDHTERMLEGLGCQVTKNGAQVSVKAVDELLACDIQVPGDISSAAFLMAAAAIVPGSELLIRDVGVNPTRTGIIDILRAMGVTIAVENVRESGGEPLADITVKSSALNGIEIDPKLVPLAIDEFPAIFIAAAFAHGETVLSGAQELRVKESDRIAAMAEGLSTLGITAQPTEDGMVIQGLGAEGQCEGGEIDSHHDHRIAMAFSLAALRSSEPVRIRDCDNVDTSFPGYVQLMQQVGLNIDVDQD